MGSTEKTVDKYLKEILKFPLKEDYQILVLPPVMDSILYKKTVLLSVGEIDVI